ncbi:MAG: HNH endonuclease [Alphaproteobacteria bacterium]|nr:HNH endonuclease [Alphaproteobacteria bacterium]
MPPTFRRHSAPPRPAWESSNRKATPRIRGRKGQALRREQLERQPFCEVCERAGLLTVATVRDHKVPLAEGGADDLTNSQSLCEGCHDIKTKAEAQRGRRRSATPGGGQISVT